MERARRGREGRKAEGREARKTKGRRGSRRGKERTRSAKKYKTTNDGWMKQATALEHSSFDTDMNPNTPENTHACGRGEGRGDLVTRAEVERNRVHTSVTAREHIHKALPESATSTTAGIQSRLLRKRKE